MVHRAQASVYDVAKRLPHYAGGLVEKEIDVLKKVAEDPAKPYVVVLGGSKGWRVGNSTRKYAYHRLHWHVGYFRKHQCEDGSHGYNGKSPQVERDAFFA